MLPTVEVLYRLLIAAILGSVIGLERERLLWAAGLRTHMLVCVGAALIMLVSTFGFADVLGRPDVTLDPSRIAAQVVSGIGFLGAGTILLRREVIRGLTTAASLWSVAAIGLAVGSGLYVAASSATVLILLILVGLKPLEVRWRRRAPTPGRIQLVVADGAAPLPGLSTVLASFSIPRLELQYDSGRPDSQVVLTLGPVPQRTLTDLVERIRGVEGVRSVKLVIDDRLQETPTT